MFSRLLLTLLVALACLQTGAQTKRFSFTESKMGSPFTIIMYANDSIQANKLSKNCFMLVDSLVMIFSDYIDSSELNKLCAAAGPGKAPTKISQELFDILSLSAHAYKKSEGTFDITLGPVTRLWRTARKQNIFPAKKLVIEKLAFTGFHKLLLDTIAHTAHLLQKGMQLDLGGIAQGYIAQKVINVLRDNNIANALVNVSGDIVAIGSPPGTKGWTVGVNAPGEMEELLNKTLLISGKAVTTSGDVYQFIYHGGKKYSHIVHPKTGYGITSQRNVTVIAADGSIADWLTKACSLLPIVKAKKLATDLDAALLIVEMKNGKMVLHTTANFSTYWK